MECHYHPDREGTDECAICGKSICKECGLEIAGKEYCKECLEKIVGLGIDNNAQEEPVATEQVESQETPEEIYQIQDEPEEYEIPYASQDESANQGISDDSPYNIRDNIEYSGGLESSYIEDSESIYQAPPAEQPQSAQNEPVSPSQEQPLTPQNNAEDFIYPDHTYEPQPTTARQELEDKYEKYLDDLYFDENEVPLNEQLAKDEAQYGSLTRREYAPRKEESVQQQPPVQRTAPKQETPEEMEARIRAEILKEQGLMSDKEDGNIHNLNYKEEKESMGIVDVLLTIILIIIILIVIYYLLYLFILNASYPTFMDAVFGLQDPQSVISNLLAGQ